MAVRKDYCCCCIPLRLAVALISLIVLAIAGYNVWSVLRDGTSTNHDNINSIVTYVLVATYGILGLAGLFASLKTSRTLAKNFNNMWWIVTVLGIIISIISLVFVLTRDKLTLQEACANGLVGTDAALGKVDELINDCYKTVVITYGVSLALNALIMIACGMVARRYMHEVKDKKEIKHQALQHPGYAYKV